MSYPITVNWSPGMSLDFTEKLIILNAFRFYQQNKTMTANSLGITVKTLDNKLTRYETEERSHEQNEEVERRARADQLARARGQYTPASSAPSISGPSPAVKPGLYVEPVTNLSAKQAVPLPEQYEVQELLPKEVAVSGTRKRR